MIEKTYAISGHNRLLNNNLNTRNIYYLAIYIYLKCVLSFYEVLSEDYRGFLQRNLFADSFGVDGNLPLYCSILSAQCVFNLEKLML